MGRLETRKAQFFLALSNNKQQCAEPQTDSNPPAPPNKPLTFPAKVRGFSLGAGKYRLHA